MVSSLKSFTHKQTYKNELQQFGRACCILRAVSTFVNNSAVVNCIQHPVLLKQKTELKQGLTMHVEPNSSDHSSNNEKEQDKMLPTRKKKRYLRNKQGTLPEHRRKHDTGIQCVGISDSGSSSES